MHLIRRYRITAIFCALAVLACELIAHPYANMGICDDGPYILMAQHLAATGHFVYNGWAAPMIGWQLYLGAAFIKLFGFSFTAVRMSTVLVAMIMAFLLQRILVRSGITERNAILGTLTLVLSPLYLMLSVNFMTDITGLFAVVLCLYGCIRALQSPSARVTIAWLCFAVLTNALFGTSRQVAWLGILVMVPSTLWLLRAQRRVLLAGAGANLAGILFMFGCLQWLKHQPYIIPEQLLPSTFRAAHTVGEFIHAFLDIPFLLLPLVAIFLPEIRKSSRRSIAVISVVALLYTLLAYHLRHSHPTFLLEPTAGEPGGWVGVHGINEGNGLHGTPPLFFHPSMQILLTILSIGGLLGLIASFLHSSRRPPAAGSTSGVSWKQLGVLLAPFCIAYSLLLIPRAENLIYDRYTLMLLVVATLCLVRYYQDRIQPQLPISNLLLIGIMAVCGIVFTHNTFALDRARVAVAAELSANGVPNTSLDNGWEFNFGTELQHANHINEPEIVLPAHAYVPTPPLAPGTCAMANHDFTPHIHPLYGISFDPDACYGLAPFAPVHYSRWLASSPGTLYIVRYTPPAKP